MERLKQRWQRSGIRLAILVLIAAGFYFLAIFVKQSWNLYQLTRELREQESVVEQLQVENEQLRQVVESYTDEEGREILVKENLPYKDPDEQVAIPVAGGGGSAAPGGEGAGEGTVTEDLTALPTWRQWWYVIFTPSLVAASP